MKNLKSLLEQAAAAAANPPPPAAGTPNARHSNQSGAAKQSGQQHRPHSSGMPHQSGPQHFRPSSTPNEGGVGSIVDNGKGTQYQIIQELGAGCFGKVAKVKRVHDGKMLAMKLQQLHDAQQAAEIQKEVRLLGGLRHPNIVSFFEDFQFHRYVCIVMEFCDGGTLNKYISKHKSSGMSSMRIYGVVLQLAEGLAFIHARSVTHRDLKSENVMMTSRLDVKIADFGCGKVIPEGSPAAPTMTGGDRMIIPPEMAHRLRGVPQSGMVGPAYDMWGLGVILSELVTLKLMRKDRCTQVPLCINHAAEAELMREAGQIHGGRFVGLLHGLLEHDPARRITAVDVKTRVQTHMATPSRARSSQSRGVHPLPVQRAAQSLGVPESKLEEAWDYFSSADTEGKGYITVDQLKSLLVLLQINVSARALMKQLGKGIDGTVDFTEFASFWLRRDLDWMAAVPAAHTDHATEATACRVFSIPPAEFTKLQTAFNRVDGDDSGDVSFLGLYQILREMDISVGSNANILADLIGPDAQERQFTFNEVLEFMKENVDWSSRKIRHRGTPRPRTFPEVPTPHLSARPTPARQKSPSSPTSEHPSSTPIPSSSSSSSTRYNVGSKVQVMRSNREWSNAEVTTVSTEGVTVTLADGSSKVVPYKTLDLFVKPK